LKPTQYGGFYVAASKATLHCETVCLPADLVFSDASYQKCDRDVIGDLSNWLFAMDNGYAVHLEGFSDY
jgi:hypothetical protein